MSRGKGASTPSLSNRDAVELFRRVDISQLGHVFRRYLPDSDPQQKGAQRLRMHCVLPGHPDHHPSFEVDFRTGVASCNVCHYRTRNLLQLFQDSKLGWGYAQSLKELQAVTGVRLVPEKLEAQYDRLDIHREALKAIAWATNKHLIDLAHPREGAGEKGAELTALLGQASIDWLFEQRGHKRDLIHTMPYGVWPTPVTLLSLCEQRLLSLASQGYASDAPSRYSAERREKILDVVRELAKHPGAEWSHAVVFITGHDISTPARIRLRRPDTANQKDGNILVLPGFSEDEPNGYFGLYAPHLANISYKERESLKLLAVEGENDTLTIAEALIENRNEGWLVIGTCGLANDTDSLTQAGFDSAYFLHDHPSPSRGRGEVWLRDRLSSCAQLNAFVFNQWDKLATSNGFVKDPDDVVRLLGFDHFHECVLADYRNVFVTCDEWAFQRASVDAQEVTGIREKTDLAAKFGECVRHPAQLASYLDRISQVLGLSPAEIRALIIKGQDDEAGFIQRVVETLSNDFYFLYREDTPRGAKVTTYHRDSRKPVTFMAGDNPGTLAALSNVVGDIYTYFQQRIGIPVWLVESRVEKTASVIKELQRTLGDYTGIALQALYQGIPAKNACEYIGLGPHSRDDGFGGTIQYINLGTVVYAGHYRPDGTMQWRTLDGPTDGNRIFATTPVKHKTVINSLTDLEAGNAVTLARLKQVVKDIATKIMPAWSLKGGNSDSLLIAYFLADLAMPHFRPDKVHLHIVGPSQTGKSSLMALFCGGQIPQLQLLDFIQYLTNYSPASIYNGFNGASITCALDEFSAEADNEMKSRQVNNLLELFRQSGFEGGAQVSRVINGQTTYLTLWFNTIATSIHLPKNVQDANRRLEIQTIAKSGHPNPMTTISANITPEEFAELRRVLNTGLFKFHDLYRKHYAEVIAEMNTKGFFPFDVDTRFVRNFYGPAAMCSMLGGSWRELVIASARARLGTQELYQQSSPHLILMETLIRSSSIRLGNHFTSVINLLGDRENTPRLNSTTHGVLYDEAKGVLVIDWIAVQSNGGILHRTEYAREQAFRLKHLLDQHPLAVPQAEYGELQVREFMAACGNAAPAMLISVIQFKEVVTLLRESTQRKPAAPATTEAPSATPPKTNV